jgi:DNA ligase-1
MAVMLAKNWTGSDPTGWWLSEKLDGVRAVWDCRTLTTRTGQPIHAPQWFVNSLPQGEHLDGELWIERGHFQETLGIVRSDDAGQAWHRVRYAVFDAPAALGGFEDRMAALMDALAVGAGPAFMLPQRQCNGQDDLRQELARIEGQGGEGVMLRQPGSTHERKRSGTLLKVKTFHDAEATVIGYESGTGRNASTIGAVVAKLPDGTEFRISSGLTDQLRVKPPAVGTVITFRFQEFMDSGAPRFPSYLRAMP